MASHHRNEHGGIAISEARRQDAGIELVVAKLRRVARRLVRQPVRR